MKRIRIVDTHTGGEPTRVVMSSPIALDHLATMEQRCKTFAVEYDDYRRAIVCEPRGSDVWVGALMTAPVTEGSAAGVIFFNNVGVLGMCGHGTIGVAIAMHHQGLIATGKHQIDTPVGRVGFELCEGNRVSIQNVASYRHRHHVPVRVSAEQVVHGDIAWGGNWFFICEDHGLAVTAENVAELSRFARMIRSQLDAQSITGDSGALIDHVDLIGVPSDSTKADSRNFVLCPGGAYDRSPCGTGTSAKVACLATDGKLQPGELFRQESIVGSVFEACYQWDESGRVVPTIEGTAYVTAEACLLLDANDPFCMGLI